jgi:hypothetical protein
MSKIFKFSADKWLLGRISTESFEVQGLFIAICALYYSKGGILSLADCKRRIKSQKYGRLIGEFIEVDNEMISINFLDLQLDRQSKISEINSKNAKVLRKRIANESLTNRYDNTTDNKEVSNENLIDKKTDQKSTEKRVVKNSPYGDGELHQLCIDYNEANKGKYPKEFYESFLLHWTGIIQKGASKGRELWRDEKTFVLAGRLATSYKMTWTQVSSGSNIVKGKSAQHIGAAVERLAKDGINIEDYSHINI